MSKSQKSKAKKATPPGLAFIELATLAFSAEHRTLTKVVARVEGNLAKARREGAAALNRVLPTVKARKEAVEKLVDEARHLFADPKTFVFDGIRVGLRKQVGSIEIEDDDKTIALIEKHCPDRLEELAPSTRKLCKEALEKLPADLLKKIAVEVSGDTDKVIVAPAKGDVEKIVKAFLKTAAADQPAPAQPKAA